MEVLLAGRYLISLRITLVLAQQATSGQKGRYPLSYQLHLYAIKESNITSSDLGVSPTSHLGSIIIPIFNAMQLSNPMLSTVDLCTIIGLSTHDTCTSYVY